MFPGQGSQSRGMGKELFDRIGMFRQLEAEIDGILGYSLRQLCLEGPDARLRDTQYTQPCLYVVNALHFLDAREKGVTPDVLLGHSLGEYNALMAAGAFDLLTGLKLVKKRGEVMALARNGGMAAVLGLEAEKVQAVLRDAGLDGLDVANFNAPTQAVISGPTEAIGQAEAVMTRAGAKAYIPLPVSAAFHSRYMQPAAIAFRDYLDGFEFQPLERPVIANVTGRPYPLQDPSLNIRRLLVGQMTGSVLWRQSVAHLKALGVTRFQEMGPGVVLSRMEPQITAASEPVTEADRAPLRRPQASAPSRETEAPPPAAPAPPPASIPAPTPVTPPVMAPPSAPAPRPRPGSGPISAQQLGSPAFRADHGVKYAYVAGSMYKGIASKELVVAMGRRGLLAYLGAGGLSLPDLEAAVLHIQANLPGAAPYGVNLLHDPRREAEEAVVDLLLRHGVRRIEAAAYVQLTPAVVRYRLAGLSRGSDGRTVIGNKILAKVSRPEVAAAFMEPAPPAMLQRLLDEGRIDPQAAELARRVPMADDICVEADSGGHTDQGVAYALMPAILSLRRELMARHKYQQPLRVGAAGGIGAPEAAAAAFILGADFILTGSINQCTVEAGTSDAVKDMLATADVQDTAYAPAGDMFEFGSKIQVLRKGLFFHTRANKLYELYTRHNALEEIDQKTIETIQTKYFMRPFEDVARETDAYLRTRGGGKSLAELSPKQRMAELFKWYFVHSTRLAMAGSEAQRVDYQVQCGPAMGAFNRWVKGGALASWRNRHAPDIGERIMEAAADLLNDRFAQFTQLPAAAE